MLLCEEFLQDKYTVECDVGYSMTVQGLREPSIQDAYDRQTPRLGPRQGLAKLPVSRTNCVKLQTNVALHRRAFLDTRSLPNAKLRALQLSSHPL